MAAITGWKLTSWTTSQNHNLQKAGEVLNSQDPTHVQWHASSSKVAHPKSLKIAPPIEIKYSNFKQGVPFTEAGIVA